MDTQPSSQERRRQALGGIVRALPMAVGYVVIGFSVAASAHAAGYSSANTVVSSTLVYAGTSQLIATKLLLAGANIWNIIATTFIVNARHLLMSSALSPMLRGMNRLQLAAFCYTLSDESFALHSTAEAQGHKASIPELLAANATLAFAWVLGSVLAISLKLDERYLAIFGLDYAPTAMFVALLALLCRDGIQRGVALFCGVVSVSLALFGIGPSSVLLSTLLGATAGSLGETWITKRSSSRS